MTTYIRIGLRYLAMFLVMKGVLAPELGDAIATDPDILMAAQVIAGAVSALVAELWYKLAKKYGWST